MPGDPKSRQSGDDRTDRRRAIEDASHSMVVEASAGTGKTSTLLWRILYLVLGKGPSGDPLRLSQICAITFTEKAAGEMKVRLRRHLEEVISGESVPSFCGGVRPSRSTEHGKSNGFEVFEARAREALRDLETASISTFHSFAVSLLKERPVEAGLDPYFSALDEVRSELFFREVWESWIGRALAERDPVLERALRNGFSLQSLQELAGTLRLNINTVRGLHCDSPPTDEQIREQIRDLLRQGIDFRSKILKPEDRLIEHLHRALDWLENPAGKTDRPSKPGNAGSASNWKGGKDTVQSVRAFIREVADFHTCFQNLPAQRILHEVVRWMMDGFLPEWGSRKRAGAILDFDDQLWMARDLLTRNRAVRGEFQARYKAFLVDEFQDTDSIQWDIVRLLSSADPMEPDIIRLRPAPGKLFIVGDPKQSIYRFRNADIETYLGIVDPENMKSLGLERLKLTTNFRSVPSILRFVDGVFSSMMQPPTDGLYQPDYLPFGNAGGRLEELPSPSVHLLGDRDGDDSNRTVREFLAIEASRIARLICCMRGSESWKVQDAGGEGISWRPPRYGDIAILLPVLSHANILEEALRDSEIPYVLEGGKFYYARSEVSSAITVLRAAANPNDSIALYGALRSIFFGLSDEDLLKARIQNLALDYREQVPEQSPLHYPFEVLRDLHRHRHDRRASESLEILLQKTGAREVLSARGFQSLANLNKLARTLRALQGEATFSQVVDLLGMMDEEGLAESESRLMEERSDAVRILSIHKAKGLDFPIVFVASLGAKRKNRTRSLLADLHARRVFGLSIGSRESGLRTPGWDRLSEEDKKREDAELVRLLYVALTRARDHLVLSTHTQRWKMDDENDRWIPDAEATRLKPLGPSLVQWLSGDCVLARWVDVDGLDAAGPPQAAASPVTKDWRGLAVQEYAALHELLRSAPSAEGPQAAMNEESAGEDSGDPREAAASRSVRLGVAFHEAMERVNLLSPDGLAEGAEATGVRHNLDPAGVRDLEYMLRTTLSSALMERARAVIRSGGQVLRETPYVRPLSPSGIEEGKIDLLFREPDGWVLVDYKTDWARKDGEGAGSYFREKYARQIRGYLEALSALSVKVVSAYLLLARTGEAISMIRDSSIENGD